MIVTRNTYIHTCYIHTNAQNPLKSDHVPSTKKIIRHRCIHTSTLKYHLRALAFLKNKNRGSSKKKSQFLKISFVYSYYGVTVLLRKQ